MGELSGRVAVVTGSSRGIGRASAVRLGAAGASVVVNYVSGADAAGAVVDEIEAAGGRAVAVRADVADPDGVRALFDAAQEHFGGVDVVVANVGTFVYAPVAEVSLEDFDRVFGVNARGTFLVLREGARRVRDGGRLIAVSTGATVTTSAGAGVYAASKAAVERIVVALAHELGGRQITANTVVPGVTRTDGMVLPPAAVDQMVAQTPLGRLGEPADVAEVIGFLAAPQSRWVTGQLLHVGGGLF